MNMLSDPKTHKIENLLLSADWLKLVFQPLEAYVGNKSEGSSAFHAANS